MILLFLFSRDSPLLKLFLIPIQLELNLLDFLIDSEYSDLNIIEPLFVLDNVFVHFFDLAL